VGLENSAQMGLAEHDKVIEASRRIDPMSRSRGASCHGERGGRRMIADSHRANFPSELH